MKLKPKQETAMADTKDENKVIKDLVDEIGEKTRTLGQEVKRRVLEQVIEKCQEKLDQLPQVDNSLPGSEGSQGNPEPTPYGKK
jgi:hypothetical protein